MKKSDNESFKVNNSAQARNMPKWNKYEIRVTCPTDVKITIQRFSTTSNFNLMFTCNELCYKQMIKLDY